MLHTIARSQVLPISLEESWAFFSDPSNLSRITPAWLCFEMTCLTPEPMYAGQVLTHRVQALPGWKSDWVTEITHVDAPRYFVDEQRLGPFAFWHHQHRFGEDGSGTYMEDIVSYALPFGLLGDLINRCLVKKRLEAIFDFRRGTLERIFPKSAAGIRWRNRPA